MLLEVVALAEVLLRSFLLTPIMSTIIGGTGYASYGTAMPTYGAAMPTYGAAYG